MPSKPNGDAKSPDHPSRVEGRDQPKGDQRCISRERPSDDTADNVWLKRLSDGGTRQSFARGATVLRPTRRCAKRIGGVDPGEPPQRMDHDRKDVQAGGKERHRAEKTRKPGSDR